MSGGGQKAPTPYQPPNQAGAAAGYQQGTNQLATAGTDLYNSVAPQLAQVTSAVQNNPYYAQALAGAQQAAQTATGTVAPMQLAGAASDAGLAQYAGSLAPGYASAATGAGQTGYNQAQSLMPAATSGIPLAPGVFNQAESYIPGTSIPLMQGAGQVMQTGFDPQSALYNQTLQQIQDSQNAIDAQQGLTGPYAAGAVGDQVTNFNIDWQNQELSRQIAALGAAGTADTQAAGNVEGLQGSAVNNFNALTSGGVNNATNLINTGTGAMNAGINTATGAVTGLTNAAVGANTAASDLGTAALNTQAGAAQLPQDIYLQQQQADLAAIQAQISGTNQSTANTQQAVADQGTYLNIGQTAAQGAINAAQVNNANANAQAAGFGQLAGAVLGMFTFGGAAGGGDGGGG